MNKASLLLVGLLAACGSTTPAADSADAARAAGPKEAPSSAPSAASSAAPSAAAESGPKPAAATDAKAELSSISLSETFSEAFQASGFNPGLADAIAAKHGAPTKKGNGDTKEWRYNKQPLGKTFSCDTLTLVKSPTGIGVVNKSVLTSDECKKVVATKKQAEDLLDAYEAMAKHSFADVNAAFEKALGKAALQKSGFVAVWQFNEDEQCRQFVVFDDPGSGAAVHVEDAPCE